MKILSTTALCLLVCLASACGAGGSTTADAVVTDTTLADGYVPDNTSPTDTGDLGDLDNGLPPVVSSTTPEDGATEVAFGAPITATFSEAMSCTTLSPTSFTLRQNTTVVSGNVTCVGDKAIFTPTAMLEPTLLYTATVSTEAMDLAGNALVEEASWSFTTWTQAAQAAGQELVPLASTSSFAILASAAITNIPTSAITGDIGLIPDAGANISGFSDPASCPEVSGKIYAVDASGPACALIDPTLLATAKTDAGIAFMDARASVRGTPQAVSGNLNGLTLYPGLYESGISLELSPGGFLYLDAQGDGNAVFIIRSATSITTEATSEVVLTNGAKAANVYWTAGSAGPVASTTYIFPVSSGHVAGWLKPLMLAPVSGVKPMSPVIIEVGMLVIAAEAKIAKLEDDTNGTIS